MVLRKAHSLVRAPLPMVVGLCLGVSVSLVLTPFWSTNQSPESHCGSVQPRQPQQAVHQMLQKTDLSKKFSSDEFSFDYGNEDDFTPRRVKSQNVNANLGHHKKLMRPRYISTELGIRDKLFVGVLSSRQTIDTLGVGFNKTVAHHVQKLLFFMDSRSTPLPGAMSIVSFSDEKPQLRPFHMLKYVADHYLQTYSYFLFVTDETYVRAERVLELVSELSISQEVYLGRPVNTEGPEHPYCDLRAGIVLSQGLLSRVLDNLDWCQKQAVSGDSLANVGTCLRHALARPCVQTTQGQTLHHYNSPALNLADEKHQLAQRPDFQRALTVHRMDSNRDFYTLHKYYTELDLMETEHELAKLQASILKMAPLQPTANASVTWPIGVSPPTKPQTRFDVIRWDFFDENNLYLSNDFTNEEEISGIHRLDIEEILNVSRQQLADHYENRFENIQLLNGYRRFAPSRGMEYILDLSMRDRQSGLEIVKRVQLVRPLSKVEIVPMPYVTESTRVNLILPVTLDTKDEVVSFLDAYAHTCLDAGDNANLFVIFIYDNLESTDAADPYSVIKSMIAYYESKYLNGARMSWMALRGLAPSKLELVEAVSERHTPESLLFFCTVAMELSVELLNRVRMNTIQGWQAFFPIGFWQYKPNLVYKTKPYPTQITISRKEGHFDVLMADHVGFYNADFMHAYSALMSQQSAQKSLPSLDLYDLFLQHGALHVFRAVEPALRLRYRMRHCPTVPDETVYHRCLRVRAEGLASTSTLAMLIFEHQQKMNQQHFQAVQDQNNPHVPQMKPNMLR